MTSVVGVYLLSGSACLVHMWVSVCVQVCLVGWGMERRGNVITGLYPECSRRPRGEEEKICIKNTFFEVWAVLNRPTTICPRERNYYPPSEHAQSSKKMATKIDLNERGERGKSDACLFSQHFNSLQSSGLCSQPVLLFALANHFLVLLLRTVNAIPEQREPVRKTWVSVWT